jgi:hypothetical protein
VEAQPGSEFPIDMLRYDTSFPAREADGVKIHNTLSRWTRATEQTPIMLESFQPSKEWSPTVGRWQSFGWYVRNVKNHGACD